MASHLYLVKILLPEVEEDFGIVLEQMPDELSVEASQQVQSGVL